MQSQNLYMNVNNIQSLLNKMNDPISIIKVDSSNKVNNIEASKPMLMKKIVTKEMEPLVRRKEYPYYFDLTDSDDESEDESEDESSYEMDELIIFDNKMIKNIFEKYDDILTKIKNVNVIYGILLQISDDKIIKIGYTSNFEKHITDLFCELFRLYNDVKFLDIIFAMKNKVMNQEKILLNSTKKFEYELEKRDGNYYQKYRLYSDECLDIIKSSIAKHT